jgi:hypothetical protein
MKFVDFKDATSMPPLRDLTPEEKAALVAQYKKEFDPVQAEAEYRDMIENGGVDAEQLLEELRQIQRANKDTP